MDLAPFGQRHIQTAFESNAIETPNNFTVSAIHPKNHDSLEYFIPYVRH
jgi:hypothetical protein